MKVIADMKRSPNKEGGERKVGRQSKSDNVREILKEKEKNMRIMED